MLTSDQIQKAKEALSRIDHEVRLIIRTPEDGVRTPDDETAFGKNLRAFAREFSELSAKIRCDFEKTESGLLHMAVVVGGRGGVHYMAIPLAGEFDPFVKTVAGSGEPLPAMPDAAEPLKIEVFIAPVCPYCAHAVEMVNKAVSVSQNLESWIVDATVFSESAAAYGIKSTPTIVVNGEPRWVGKITVDDFKGLLQTEHDWGVNLKSQVAAGSVDEAVETALNHPESVKGIVELLAADEFSSRLGALRIVEETADQIPEAFKAVVPDLCGLLDHSKAPIRGDAAYALGLIGDPSAKDSLLARRNDDDPEVRESVEEALENLN